MDRCWAQESRLLRAASGELRLLMRVAALLRQAVRRGVQRGALGVEANAASWGRCRAGRVSRGIRSRLHAGTGKGGGHREALNLTEAPQPTYILRR